MNKWIIFGGILLAVFFMMKFEAGEIGTNDIFEWMDVAVEDGLETEEERQPEADGYFEMFEYDEAYYDAIFEEVEGSEGAGPYESRVYAAILPSNFDAASDIAEFFVRLKATQDVETFVVIGENHSWKGHYSTVCSRYGYETPYGRTEPDINFLKELNVSSSFGAFNNEYSVGIFAAFIKKVFPEARIVPIVIKDFENEENLEALAENLADILDEGMFLIASSDFAQGISDRTALFHDELSRNVLENFDNNGISQMDTDSRPVLTVLFNYLDLLGSKMVSINSNKVYDSTSHFVATFHEGTYEEDRDLTIMAFGDMMLGRHVRILMDQYGKDYIFENIKGFEGRFFEGADVIFGNLEGPIYGQGKKGGTSMNFSFNEDIAPFLVKNGFNLVSIANNHALDQGWIGRDTTIAALDASGLGWCGHPTEPDYESVYYGKVSDKSYAFLCFQDVTHKLDDEAAVALIKTVRPGVDYLVVSIHWGYEYKHSPDWGTEISPGRAFVDAGADFVIGHHPHVVQSFEEYNGKFIFYSLGNFVFDQYWSVMTQEELAIGIVLDDMDEGESLRTKVYLFPMKSVMSQSRQMTDEEYDRWIEKFIGYGEYSDEMKEQIRSGIIEIGN